MPLEWDALLNDEKVIAMSDQSFRAYMHLLRAAWQSDTPASLPDNDNYLARVAGLGLETWQQVKPEVSVCFRATSGRWHQKRMRQVFDEVMARRNANSDRGKAGAARRWENAQVMLKHSSSNGSQSESESQSKSQSQIPIPLPPPPPASDEPKDPRHYAISSQWGELYRGSFGQTYVFVGRDANALKKFLAVSKVTSDDFLALAVKAWERTKQDRFAKACRNAATIHGFCMFWNEIQVELRAGDGANGSRPINKLNAGFA